MPPQRGTPVLVGRQPQAAALRRHLAAAGEGAGARLVVVHAPVASEAAAFTHAVLAAPPETSCPVRRARRGPTRIADDTARTDNVDSTDSTHGAEGAEPTETADRIDGIDGRATSAGDDIHVVVGLPWESALTGALHERVVDALSGDDDPHGSVDGPNRDDRGRDTASERTRDVTHDLETGRGAGRVAHLLTSHARAAGRRLVLVVEEGQAADAASLRMLSSAIHRCGAAPVVVIVCAGEAPAPDAGGHAPADTTGALVDLAVAHREGVVILMPLGADDVRRVAAHVSRHLLPRTAAQLAEHTGGRVGDVLELLDDHPDLDAQAAQGALPASRRGTLLMGRAFERATAPTRALIEAAAVLPADSALDELARIAGLDDPLPPLDEAAALGVLRAVTSRDGVLVRFATPNLRAAAYAGLPLTRRRHLHARAAELVADPGERLRQRASAAAGVARDDGFASAHLVADLVAHADREAGQGRWEGAASSLGAALTVTAPGPSRDDLLVRTLDAITAAGDIPQATLFVPRVEGLPHSPRGDAALAYVAMNEGRRLQAGHLLSRAWASINPARHPEEAALVAQRRTLHALFDWHADDLVTWAERTGEHGGPDLPPVLESQVIVGLGHGAAGRPDAARAAYEATETLGHGPQAQRALMGRGWLDLAQDRVHQAAWRLQTAAPTRYRRGSVRVSLWSLAWLARTRFVLGEWDAALDAVQEAERLVDTSGIGAVAALAHWTGAEIHALRGDEELAQRHAVLAESGAQEYATTLVPSALARVHVHRARGDHAGVLRACEPLLALRRIRPIDEPGFWPWQDLYADACIALGRLDDADEFLTPLEAVAAHRDHHSTRARLGAPRGRLHAARGDLDAARSAFDDAATLCADLPMPYLLATTRFAKGVTLRHAGHRREAAEPLREARDLFARLGAAPLVAQCERELGAGRAGVAHPAEANNTDDAAAHLTPQEEAVVALVARGRKNRDIAADLFVSVKTVEYHLTRIYAKVGVSSRGELAAWYRRD